MIRLTIETIDNKGVIVFPSHLDMIRFPEVYKMTPTETQEAVDKFLKEHPDRKLVSFEKVVITGKDKERLEMDCAKL